MMFSASTMSDLRKEQSLILPEEQYHLLLCVRLTKLGSLKPQKLC